ncbi:MAG: lipopolysaccharide assembly protein LapA domain-containing protein [Paracoccaceae bacterium]
MRLIKLLVLAVIAIALVTVSIANRGALTLKLLPDELAQLVGFRWDVTLPAFVILLGAVLIGVLLGFVWEWVREHKFRAEANTQRRERERLEREVKKVAPSKESGDDVLALLEGT